MTAPRCIASFPKNSREEIRVCLTEHLGHRLVDYRIYAPFAGPAKAMAATGKGVSLGIDKITELISALERARDEARALGWMEGGG